MILLEEQARKIIENNKSVSAEFIKLREQSKMLYALIEGDDFKDALVNKIEFIESEKKSEARQKYARDTQDLFERLFQPLENISYATGGNKVYDIENEDVKKDFLRKISNIKNNNTLSHWIQDVGLKVRHVDPNGLMFLEYTTKIKNDIFPTYKSIFSIRNYEKNGQLLEWVLFEPIKSKYNGVDVLLWRIVDDLNDRTFIEIGQSLILSDKSFKHPFGEVPAILNSNIKKTGYDYLISPVHSIIGLAKEYGRDQTIKTLYKFTQGYTIHWRYVTFCEDCKGRGKIEDKTCTSCNGTGKLGKGDVTDIVELEVPTGDSKPIAPNIAGHIKPDGKTWNQYTDEISMLERYATITFWGTPLNSIETFGGRKTTVEVLFNKQPMENRLNKYADYSEFVEWKMSEWILNFIDLAKDRKDNKITITYGRNYVVEPSDTILKRYEEGKRVQENDVIMDELFRQYLQAEYRTNPVELYKNLKKSKIEPYLHQSLNDVERIFGVNEAQKKILFSKWWDSLKDYKRTDEELIKEYDIWFKKNKIEINAVT